MATTAAWVAYVEYAALQALGDEFCQLDSADTNAVEVALQAAAHHAHNTFKWSVELRQLAAEPAAAVVKEAVTAALDAATAGRRAFLSRVRNSSTRPVVTGSNVVVDGCTFSTSKAEAAVSIWDLEHPASGFLSDVRAARLERSDATGVYSFLSNVLSTEAVNTKAAKLARQAQALTTAKRKR